METKMTMTAVRTALKTEVAEQFVQAFEGAIQIEDFEYAIPFETELGKQYVRVAMTAADTVGTKVRKAFDPETAIEKWHARLEQAALNRENLAAKRAEAKAAKEAAKAPKAE